MPFYLYNTAIVSRINAMISVQVIPCCAIPCHACLRTGGTVSQEQCRAFSGEKYVERILLAAYRGEGHRTSQE
jgi:hypothetical protein